MKKNTALIIIIVALFALVTILSSCTQSVVLDQEDRNEVTTVAMQKAAEADSTQYHVLFEDNTIYVLDSDKIVVAVAYSYDIKYAVFVALFSTILGVILTILFIKTIEKLQKLIKGSK